MCNNIFQYIQMYAWGRDNGRKTMSMRFAYKYPHFAIRRYPYHSFFFYLVAKVLSKIWLLPTIDFDSLNSFEEGEEMIKSHRHCHVVGWSYLRRPELVDKYLPEIQQMFAFDEEVQEAVDGRMDDTTINIGVHIRRGDYKTFQNGRLYFEDDEYCRYVNKLISLLPAGNDVNVHICTNDMLLNRAYYTENVNATVHFPNGSPTEDLCLLSRCDYLLGPNSSYTLIATMYGKARLFWMHHEDVVEVLEDYVGEENMTIAKFGDYKKMSRLFDMGFVSK